MKKFWNLYFKIGATWGTCWAAAYAMRELTNATPDEHPMLKAVLRTLVAGTVWPLDMADILKRNTKEDK
jgi:hypothetical protein